MARSSDDGLTRDGWGNGGFGAGGGNQHFSGYGGFLGNSFGGQGFFGGGGNQLHGGGGDYPVGAPSAVGAPHRVPVPGVADPAPVTDAAAPAPAWVVPQPVGEVISNLFSGRQTKLKPSNIGAPGSWGPPLPNHTIFKNNLGFPKDQSRLPGYGDGGDGPHWGPNPAGNSPLGGWSGFLQNLLGGDNGLLGSLGSF